MATSSVPHAAPRCPVSVSTIRLDLERMHHQADDLIEAYCRDGQNPKLHGLLIRLGHAATDVWRELPPDADSDDQEPPDTEAPAVGPYLDIHPDGANWVSPCSHCGKPTPDYAPSEAEHHAAAQSVAGYNGRLAADHPDRPTPHCPDCDGVVHEPCQNRYRPGFAPPACPALADTRA